ncbi:MAG TPA: heparan-alpha-glucosaminide N-acetyltransferase domain-containing protein [Vicinamibacterales bacterium]|jgi:uncharacterized membrane protein
MNAPASRKRYLDWLRGVAVLVMIEAHIFDSWTRPPDTQTTEFGYAMIVGGLGAPLFLFLAGVAVPLSAGAKLRRSGDHAAASRAVARRGLEIFGLAFLFRVQSWILGWGPARNLLKIDILNIMGPSIAAAALLWRASTSCARRLTLFAAAAAATAIATPLVRLSSLVGALPEPIKGYVAPVPGLSNFVFFPWAGFVFAGALVGLVIDRARTPEQERRANIIFGVSGAAAALLAYEASFLPSLYRESHFWTTSPAFFLLRAGMMTAAVSVAFAWLSRSSVATKWSPLEQLGRTSLFIYWIHVELIYGLISLDLHDSLTWGQTWIGYVLFTLFMLLCSIAKEKVETWWKKRSSDRTTKPIAMPASDSIQPS